MRRQRHDWLLLNQISYHLLTVLLYVLSARDMYPEVFAVGGFDNDLVEVGVLDDSVEPAVKDGLVGMGFAIAPFDVGSLGNLDVGSFAYCMLRGIDTTYLDV